MTGHDWPGVRLEYDEDGVALLTLAAPERLNAMDDEMMTASLPAALERIASDQARALVLTGDGRGFCAGVDLNSTGFAFDDPVDAERFIRTAHAIPAGIRTLGIPAIAAVNGPAVGAGFGLALACDLRVAAPGAYFQSAFVKLGLVPDFGVSYFLPRAVGVTAALDLTLTGRKVDAEEARAIGLVSRVADDALAVALDMAARIAQSSRYAVETTRSNVYASMDLSLEAEVLDLEPRTQALTLAGAEFRERFARHRAAVLKDQA